MKLTRSVSYALGILLRVQNNKSNGPMTAAAISKGCDLPPRFLYRILRRMVDGGLMTGVSGPGGGYSLAIPPQEITLLDIVQAVEGPPSATVLKPVHRTQKSAVDRVNDLCSKSAVAFSKELGKVTLAKLAGK